VTDQAAAQAWLRDQRVARLATADAAGVPHVIPACFQLSADAGSLYITVDEKPKDASRPLKRVRNILENPQVALVVDHYAEDWGELCWVMVRGQTDILADGPEHDAAQELLCQKYAQYKSMTLGSLPVIAIRAQRWTWWGI
jgi:PPOX class probable F420-dependent enzyme